jgi:hypothetical protein
MRAILIALAILASFLAGVARAEGPSVLGEGEILRGTFVQERILQGFDAPLKSEGDFVLAPGRGLIWRTTNPFAVTTLMTDKGLAQQSDGTTTLDLPTSRAPFMAGLYIMLTGALAGNWTTLEQAFAVERSEADGKWHLRLRPKGTGATAEMPISEIRLTGTTFVDTVEIEKQGGDLDRLTFAGQQRQKAPLTPAEQALLEAVEIGRAHV